MNKARSESFLVRQAPSMLFLVLFFLAAVAAPAWAEMGPKTKKAIDKVNGKIAECQAKAEVLAEWAHNFHEFTKSIIKDNNEIKTFDDDSLAVTSWDRRSKTWRQVKDKLKKAYNDYHKTCAGITKQLKKIDKLKNK